MRAAIYARMSTDKQSTEDPRVRELAEILARAVKIASEILADAQARGAPSIPEAARQSAALLKVPEAARLLNVSRARAYDLVSRGIVPSIRAGRAIRISRAALDAWIAAGGKREAGSNTGRRTR